VSGTIAFVLKKPTWAGSNASSSFTANGIHATWACKEVQQFLSHLAVAGHVAASTQSQALSALLFLYQQVLKQDMGWLDHVVRAKQSHRVPVVLTQDEVKAVLAHLSGTTWIMATLLYGAGLRLLECLRLRVKDVDFTYNGCV
jgi:site-specific recombinase XerD